MLSQFTRFETVVDDEVTIVGWKRGNGQPLLLLHGFPQNHLIWHRIADELSRTYTVVAIDLRGYGESSKPPDDGDHKTYSKRAMAHDCVKVLESLGHNSFYICAHDRGARVTHKLCVDYPSAVKKAMLLDIAPTVAMYSKTDFDTAKAYYHWFFLIQPSPFPENLILGNPDAFMAHHVSRSGKDAEIFSEECYKSYVNMMRDPAAVHAMCEDYRASASVDMSEHREDDANGRKIECPLMVLWGKHGLIEKKFDALEEWKSVSNSTVVGEALDCGHYIPEEVPETLLSKILEFCAD